MLLVWLKFSTICFTFLTIEKKLHWVEIVLKINVLNGTSALKVLKQKHFTVMSFFSGMTLYKKCFLTFAMPRDLRDRFEMHQHRPDPFLILLILWFPPLHRVADTVADDHVVGRLLLEHGVRLAADEEVADVGVQQQHPGVSRDQNEGYGDVRTPFDWAHDSARFYRLQAPVTMLHFCKMCAKDYKLTYIVDKWVVFSGSFKFITNCTEWEAFYSVQEKILKTKSFS